MFSNSPAWASSLTFNSGEFLRSLKVLCLFICLFGCFYERGWVSVCHSQCSPSMPRSKSVLRTWCCRFFFFKTPGRRWNMTRRRPTAVSRYGADSNPVARSFEIPYKFPSVSIGCRSHAMTTQTLFLFPFFSVRNQFTFFKVIGLFPVQGRVACHGALLHPGEGSFSHISSLL